MHDPEDVHFEEMSAKAGGKFLLATGELVVGIALGLRGIREVAKGNVSNGVGNIIGAAALLPLSRKHLREGAAIADPQLWRGYNISGSPRRPTSKQAGLLVNSHLN